MTYMLNRSIALAGLMLLFSFDPAGAAQDYKQGLLAQIDQIAAEGLKGLEGVSHYGCYFAHEPSEKKGYEETLSQLKSYINQHKEAARKEVEASPKDSTELQQSVGAKLRMLGAGTQNMLSGLKQHFIAPAQQAYKAKHGTEVCG